ncbi:helix-turn-helix domain-containing protein [Hymenobacter sp. BRD67]|uniref:helix-turn-helix domain-containing protein n=1 Tax=Hymenobacter sp. BRD67 TaxID=2675877 RepID=UPI0015662CFD|nr:helix-turn-helix transcriptional regulator [Hymenobacter sp. BRD67]QKG54971.1 helix-turn-helix transcriptional regulator [Hymenobacter sp. BRD67]
MTMQEFTPGLGNNIKTLRENMGLNQQLLAEYLGVSRGEVSYFETEARRPNLTILRKLSDLFGVSLADLLSTEPTVQALNAAFAFRSAGAISLTHLEQIASFRRIVSNYVRLDNLLSRED